MKYSEKDMANLIGAVETQFAEHLVKAETEKDQKLEKGEKAAQETEEAKAKAPESVEKSKIEKAEEEAVEASDKAQLDYNDEDITEMNKMYTSMSKSEAEAHYKSVKKALFGEVSKDQSEQPSEIKKAETEVEASSDEKTEEKEGNELFKSEIAGLKEENEGLKKNLEKLVGSLTKSVKKSTAPKQKAITRIEFIAKSEEETPIEKKEEDVLKLDKSEISARLSEKIREGSLKKSEKEAINIYYLDGQYDIASIKHLL